MYKPAKQTNLALPRQIADILKSLSSYSDKSLKRSQVYLDESYLDYLN